ncbi:MAG: ribose 5-phosphate isomerase B [Bdellovibrionales bacterium]|nr:ribose 5-phosphate isomerase B [Bdellovibrionales bacterium]
MNTKTSQVMIASDHAGIELKTYLQSRLSDIEWLDLGPQDLSSVDYPDYAQKLCKEVLQRPGSCGVLICGTGIGMSIAANKIKGIRAALVTNTEMAAMAKRHNNANVLCLGARITTQDQALACVQAWIEAEFEGDRHQRRLDKLES